MECYYSLDSVSVSANGTHVEAHFTGEVSIVPISLEDELAKGKDAYSVIGSTIRDLNTQGARDSRTIYTAFGDFNIYLDQSRDAKLLLFIKEQRYPNVTLHFSVIRNDTGDLVSALELGLQDSQYRIG